MMTRDMSSARLSAVEDEVEQSFGRARRQYDGRSERTNDLTSSIIPRGTSFHRWVELDRTAFFNLPAARHHRDPLAWLNQRCSSIVKGLTFCVAAAPDSMRGAMDLVHMGARL